MDSIQRLCFLTAALQGVGRIDTAEKVIYLPFNIQLSPVHAHDITELKHFYKYRVQYEIPE